MNNNSMSFHVCWLGDQNCPSVIVWSHDYVLKCRSHLSSIKTQLCTVYTYTYSLPFTGFIKMPNYRPIPKNRNNQSVNNSWSAGTQTHFLDFLRFNNESEWLHEGSSAATQSLGRDIAHDGFLPQGWWADGKLLMMQSHRRLVAKPWSSLLDHKVAGEYNTNVELYHWYFNTRKTGKSNIHHKGNSQKSH